MFTINYYMSEQIKRNKRKHKKYSKIILQVSLSHSQDTAAANVLAIELN